MSFYPFKMYCVFVCKFGESFMAVIDGLVVVYWGGGPSILMYINVYVYFGFFM